MRDYRYRATKASQKLNVSEFSYVQCRTTTLIVYARVSTTDQKLDLQRCVQVFFEIVGLECLLLWQE
ncbi:hypothetical protein AC20117_10530 [Arthrobacter crystallopoietes]|nr:hypothetical protein AC20117_10530 [Arthrobacter crystallopoietes]